MERIVIIPALNPEEGLRDLVEANWNRKNQVILVDDGSDEKYEKLFRELSEKCIVLHHKRNQGKGAAIKTALRYIKEELWECSVIGIMDADGQHLPEDMEKILMKAESEPSALILGSRTIDQDVPWKSAHTAGVPDGYRSVCIRYTDWDESIFVETSRVYGEHTGREI